MKPPRSQTIRAVLCATFPSWPLAAPAHEPAPAEHAPINAHDLASRSKRAAKMFSNDCLNCPARLYALQPVAVSGSPSSRSGHLICYRREVGELMQVAMDNKDAKVNCLASRRPDLTLTARSRSVRRRSGAADLFVPSFVLLSRSRAPDWVENLGLPTSGCRTHGVGAEWPSNSFARELFESEHAAKAARIATKGVCGAARNNSARSARRKEIEKFVLKTDPPAAGAVVATRIRQARDRISSTYQWNYMADPARLQRRQLAFTACCCLFVLVRARVCPQKILL